MASIQILFHSLNSLSEIVFYARIKVLRPSLANSSNYSQVYSIKYDLFNLGSIIESAPLHKTLISPLGSLITIDILFLVLSNSISYNTSTIITDPNTSITKF